MNDTLLFLHVLAGFMLMANVVMLGAVALGAPANQRQVLTANMLWDVGGLGTLAFGVWLVLRIDGYDIVDGWILGAIALWVLANAVAPPARRSLDAAMQARTDPEGPPAWMGAGVWMHWLRSLTVIGFLVLMVWKPGA